MRELSTMKDLKNGVYYKASTNDIVEIWNVDKQEISVLFNFATGEYSDFTVMHIDVEFDKDVIYLGEL